MSIKVITTLLAQNVHEIEAGVREREMLTATKEKMSGGEKKKSEQEHVRHFLHKTCNQEVSERCTL